METRNSSWNTAALWATLPRQCLCDPPHGLLHSLSRPKHFRSSVARISSKLDMKPVGFLIALGSLLPDLALICSDPFHALELQRPGGARLRPRRRGRQVFAEDACAALNLFAAQVAAPLEVSSSYCVLFRQDPGVASGVVYTLEVREGREHEAPMKSVSFCESSSLSAFLRISGISMLH